MQYEGAVYRPPSEADSLIIQLTIGCARNTCTFCYMYKDKTFRVRPIDEVLAELEAAAKKYSRHVRRIFLADGDALVVPTPELLRVIRRAMELFPLCKRVSVYGASADVLLKTPDELVALREAGMGMVYVGAESGDDQILREIKKGVTATEIITACQMLRAAGIEVSMTFISGLGQLARSRAHAVACARMVSAIKPEYMAFLTLRFYPGTPLNDDYQAGRFVPITPPQIVDELTIFLEEVDSEGTVFRTNHASNYVMLAGTLNLDRQRMLDELAEVKRQSWYRDERWLAL